MSVECMLSQGSHLKRSTSLQLRPDSNASTRGATARPFAASKERFEVMSSLGGEARLREESGWPSSSTPSRRLRRINPEPGDRRWRPVLCQGCKFDIDFQDGQTVLTGHASCHSISLSHIRVPSVAVKAYDRTCAVRGGYAEDLAETMFMPKHHLVSLR